MIPARQSTAKTVTVGPVLDADGVAVTGGVVGDFKLSKAGAAPAALNGSATLTHRHTGFYSLALTATDLDTIGTAEIVIDDTVNTCPMKTLVVMEEDVFDTLYASGATVSTVVDANLVSADAASINEAAFHADTAKYQAKVWVFDDDSGTADRYVTVWHRNGEPITAGITVPTIQVIKAADGTDLVASTSMTQIASTGLYRYVESTNRIVNGTAYIAKVAATIDGSTRTWFQPVGRDG